MARTRPPHALALVLAIAGCSSGTKASPSASASARSPAATAPTSTGITSGAVPEASSSAGPRLSCLEDAFRNASPAYCITLDRGGRPKPPQLEGAWMTTDIGPSAVLSYSKTVTVDAAAAELRKAWNDDFVKAKSHYEEKTAGDKTVIRFKHFDPKEDPNAAEATDVLVVLGKSGEYTIRCETDSGLTSETVCLSLVLPASG